MTSFFFSRLFFIPVTLTTSAMSTTTHAGILDTGKHEVDVLFEEGNYAELFYGHVSPNITGKDLKNEKINNVAQDIHILNVALKLQSPDERFGSLLQINQPQNNSISYDSGVFKGLSATSRSHAITGLLQFKATPHLSVYGGVGYDKTKGAINFSEPVGMASATASILANQKLTLNAFTRLKTAANNCLRTPTQGECPRIILQAQTLTNAIKKLAEISSVYSGDLESNDALRGILGLAYEYPDYALKANLTYYAASKQDFNLTEKYNILTDPITVVTPVTTRTIHVETPQSINLNLQTGITPDTLLISKLHWTNWKDTRTSLPKFSSSSSQQHSKYTQNQLASSVGVVQRLTDQLSGFIMLEYDTGKKPSSVFDGYSGSKGLTLGAHYKFHNNMDIALGVNYAKLGRADIKDNGVQLATFEDNSSLSVGTKVGFRF